MDGKLSIVFLNSVELNCRMRREDETGTGRGGRGRGGGEGKREGGKEDRWRQRGEERMYGQIEVEV